MTIEGPLASAVQSEQERECNGKGDCEGHQLLPLASPLSLATQSPPLTSMERRKLRQKYGKKLRLSRKKKTSRSFDYKLRSTWAKKFDSPRSIRVQFDAENLTAATNAWIGSKTSVKETHPTLEELKSQGYRYIEWNGK